MYRGAIIDTLDVSAKLQFGTDSSKAYVDFTNAIVTGLTDTNAVAFHKGSAQINGSTDPAIWIQQSDAPGGTNDFMRLVDSGTVATTVFDINKNGDLTISPVNGTALTVTGAAGSPGMSVTGAAGQDGADFTTSGAGSGIKVKNTTAGGTAITIDGAVHTGAGADQPSGNATVTILAGKRTISTGPILNAVVSATSNIICSATIDPAVNTSGDSYTATVIDRGSGTFTIRVICVEGDVPANEAVIVSWWIVN